MVIEVRTRLEPMDVDECLQLLADHHLGLALSPWSTGPRHIGCASQAVRSPAVDSATQVWTSSEVPR